MINRAEPDGARRCSRCSILYPPSMQFRACLACGEETSYFMNAGPDEDWREKVADILKPVQTRPPADARANRVWNYLNLGFDEPRADVLADCRYHYGFDVDVPLHWGTVADALEAGCTHDQAFDIFA